MGDDLECAGRAKRRRRFGLCLEVGVSEMDSALARVSSSNQLLEIQSAVAASLCRRTPNHLVSLDAITFAAVAPAPTAPAIVGASGLATSPIAKTLATLVSCCEPTIT